MLSVIFAFYISYGNNEANTITMKHVMMGRLPRDSHNNSKTKFYSLCIFIKQLLSGL